jgi:hypothetical protein
MSVYLYIPTTLIPKEKTWLPTEYVAQWALNSVRKFRRKDKPTSLPGIEVRFIAVQPAPQSLYWICQGCKNRGCKVVQMT